ncbi:EKC/KEOPS complex subunit TP53RK [Battus philenor]|uniref:EKC/KEOPS complex subunit TP53RK n=1 Tax=Battus philenor TaxID=42288 RepID=UPI0035D09751
MAEDLKLLKQGAEAKLYTCNYLGKPTLIKERFKKNYRHPDLDETLTKERIKNEARSILRCILADVRTPALYLVDFERRRIYMQHFEHCITVKDYIINIVKKEKNSEKSLNFIAKVVAEAVRKMHDNNIIHGDLTTSNMLLIEKTPTKARGDAKWTNQDNLELIMIDFGLSYIETSAEDKGVDLYVLERALISTHNDYPKLFEQFLDFYKGFSKNNIKEILSKFDEVRARGRKRTMVG